MSPAHSNRSQVERLKARIARLERQYEDSRGPSTSPGNPYWRCKECGVHDPELSLRKGKHFGNCPAAGLLNQIKYYKTLLGEPEDL